MANFIGEYICKVDSKGRILLPSAFLRRLNNPEELLFVVKKDIYENCLALYIQSDWENEISVIRNKLNPFNKEHNNFLREFYKGTAEISLDNANRMLIPKRLFDLINIKSEVYLIGIDTKIEIWTKETYENNCLSNSEFENLAQKLLGLPDNIQNNA